MGIVSTFYAVTLGAWEYFHVDTAKAKILECMGHEDYLNSVRIAAAQMRGKSKGKLLEAIGENRKHLCQVRERALGYERTRFRFLKMSVFFFFCSTVFQVAAGILA